MTAILLTVNIIICAALVGLILLQRTDPSAGGMFGGTGGSGPAVRNPLAKPTAYLAAAFMLISLVIAYTSKGQGSHESVTAGHEVPAPAESSAPDAAASDADLLAPIQAQPEAAIPAQALPEPAVPGNGASPAPAEAQ